MTPNQDQPKPEVRTKRFWKTKPGNAHWRCLLNLATRISSRWRRQIKVVNHFNQGVFLSIKVCWTLAFQVAITSSVHAATQAGRISSGTCSRGKPGSNVARSYLSSRSSMPFTSHRASTMPNSETLMLSKNLVIIKQFRKKTEG